jgi:macrolide-specific efflux system membrane fusion protein
MTNKKILIIILAAILTIGIVAFSQNQFKKVGAANLNTVTTTSSVKFVSSAITAEGSVTAQNQATLRFQISGKLVYLPFKEGSEIKKGQTIASLDSYTTQKQLEAALNTYRSVRQTFDQTENNVQDNVQKAQMTYPYDYYSRAGMGLDLRENAINDAIKRIVDQNQANLDNSVINVELANNAFQLSTITSPLDGILLRADVKTAGINVTPTTSFVVADPKTAVFRANIPVSVINYVKVGAKAEIAVDGLNRKLSGVVTDIYPGKIVLPSGASVYQVDILSSDLFSLAKLEQTGTAIIKTNAENVALVPAWIVLNGKQLWVENHGQPILKSVTVGKVHGEEIEISSGLNSEDKIITDPQYLQQLKY